ncbi:formate dehydrogenase gamma subunit [Desulfitispora alkaliphila]|uniref:formate dehydrogenase subunit gamma n=1 Tax=Desulfitispora alkaliphila TaxID=622674 RepID=UPI003D1A7957
MKQKITRHSKAAIFVHWTVAISTFLLLFSGFGQMPMYKRYNVVNIPGLSWADNYLITIQIHYIAAAILIFAVVFHLIYHCKVGERAIIPRRGDVKESIQIVKAMFGFGEEPKSDKFLAEQRLAYIFIGINILALIISGFIKVIQNIDPLLLPHNIYTLSTAIHNLATIMLIAGIAAHLMAFIIKENRPLFLTMFTGKVDYEYVKHRHSKWYDKLKKNNGIDV